MPSCNPATGNETRQKIEALIGADSSGVVPNKEIIKWLYDALSILDGKANGLLRVNGFFLALLAGTLAFFRFIREDSQKVWLPKVHFFDLIVYIGVTALLFLCSSMVCIWVVRVSWRILGKVTLAEARNSNFSREINALSHAVNDRT